MNALSAVQRAEQAWSKRPDMHHPGDQPSPDDVVPLPITRRQRDAISALAHHSLHALPDQAMYALGIVTWWDAAHNTEEDTTA